MFLDKSNVMGEIISLNLINTERLLYKDRSKNRSSRAGALQVKKAWRRWEPHVKAVRQVGIMQFNDTFQGLTII